MKADDLLDQMAFEAGVARLRWEYRDELRAFAVVVAGHCAAEMIRMALALQIEGRAAGPLQFADEAGAKVAGLFD